MTEKFQLKKLDDWRWLLPKTGGMHTEGMIYASENMIGDIYADNAILQVSNVAHLPGIVGRSLAMPDIHLGYGFPIGGVAAFDYDNGIISPGGIGYDINCLAGNTKILHKFGFYMSIKEFESLCQDNNAYLVCFDFIKDLVDQTKINKFIKIIPENNTYKIITQTGYQIIATDDHPFYTYDGMKFLRELSVGEEIAVYPFSGIEYEKPSDKIILQENDIVDKINYLNKRKDENFFKQIINTLKKCNLLPLKYNSSKLPYILKLFGYFLGKGSIHFVDKTNKGIIYFYCSQDDLEEIIKDIAQIGLEFSTVYQKKRNFEILCALHSTSFAVLLVALGMPFVKKTDKYRIPEWIFKSNLWQKRLFLSSFFGAKLSCSKTITNHRYNFMCPEISINKTEFYVESGRKFLEDISYLLNEFKITTKEISYKIEYPCKQKKKIYSLKLLISNISDNLINLYSKIGFEYNIEKKYLCNIAVLYLRTKKIIINKRKEELLPVIQNMHSNNETSPIKMYGPLPIENQQYVNSRYIEEGNFSKYNEFIKNKTIGLGKSGMVWDKIISIQKIQYSDYVYDFTVEHKNHNFVANNFVVSNCGVRLIRTNLIEQGIKPHLEKLISVLFTNIPSGVGSTGRLNLNKYEVIEVLKKGAKWAVQKGFGTEDDLKHTEENGIMKDADPTKVSQHAIQRGREQLGTLGAGNHFLEIQVVDEIYNNEIAKEFGLFKDQITIMIHSGSRGLGYQVCDDYIRILHGARLKYRISVPDEELVCAPVTSPEGSDYFKAMCSSANYAWANRQCIMHWTRETFIKVLGSSTEELGLELVYDVAHNIGKIEEYKGKKLIVHRKGATRSFPGQPVIIPGSMGTNSYVLVGTQKAMEETFGSTCHGAGRLMSRTKALKHISGKELLDQLKNKGIIAQAKAYKTLSEEAPQAYKDVNLVVEVCHQAGISQKVAKLKPIGVIKG